MERLDPGPIVSSNERSHTPDKQAPSICHLAVTPETVHVVHVGPEGKKVFPPRPGRFPQEYLDHIQSQRRSAQRSIKLAQLAMRNKNDLLRMNARTSIANAKAKLRSIKVGPPFVNRVTIVARVAGSPAKITFDFAGKERDASEQETQAFVAALESASSQWGKSAPAEEAAPASAPPRKKIVGCPGCKAKLRATKPGIIRCPRCSAKVRVQESQFAS